MAERTPMTLRRLAEWMGKSVEDLLDAELSVGVHDGHRHFDSYPLTMEAAGIVTNFQRVHFSDDEARAYLRLDALLSRHRLVKEREAA